jgi:hypothetical protein
MPPRNGSLLNTVLTKTINNATVIHFLEMKLFVFVNTEVIHSGKDKPSNIELFAKAIL